MRNLLKAVGAVIGIAAAVLALVMAFGSVGPPRGQPAALAPTPTPTPPAKVAPSPLLTNPVIPPSLTVTPRPAPSVVVDLTFIPEGPPTPRPGPSPTPRPPLPPTGGPYISEKEALEKASIFTGRPGNQVSATVPPRAIFTTGGNINSVLGDALPASASQREVWIVVFEGRFTHLTAPPAPTGYRAVSAVFSKTFVVLDATTGEMTMAAVKDEIEPGRLEKQ